jgi:alkylation response protein AidB-like acyl-CoA dehydrogenase
MAELGWLGILVPEKHGGMGLGFSEMRMVLEGLATVLAPEPVCACAVLTAGVLRHCGDSDVVAELLHKLAAGEVIPATAWQERAGSIDPDAAATTARAFEGGHKLNGIKQFVHGAADADGYVVSARAPGGALLAWIPASAGGITPESTALADGRTMATVKLADVIVPREHVLAEGGKARQALERALDETLVMCGAELNGVMRRALDMSLDYMKSRVQFGKPIGSFQTLAHRAVDLYLQRELSAAVVDDAVAVLDAQSEPRERTAMASRVKSRCSGAALRITRESIHIHGAIGFAEEHDIGLYLKRAMVLASWLGNAALHRRRYAQLAPLDLS